MGIPRGSIGENREERPRKSQRKEKFGKTRGRDIREDTGKRMGKKTQRRVRILRYKEEKRKEKDRERQKGGETRKVWENRGEGKEVGNVTGASGWQGWVGWGRAGK